MYLICGKCGRSNRFKGKKSEISRGVNVKCRCQAIISTSKKTNGTIVVVNKK